MAKTNLGKVGITPAGSWNSNKADYQYLDLVRYDHATNGGAYVVKLKEGYVPAGTLPTNTTYFALVVKDGTNGSGGGDITFQDVVNALGFTPADEADLNNKVDKIAGKGLSDQNYSLTEKNKLEGLSNYDDSAILTSLGNKVDKIAGKSLSDQNYTIDEKNKLAGLESPKFKGQYTSYAQLVAAGAGEVGAYAYVDLGAGSNVEQYIWDSSDALWVAIEGSSTAETPTSVKAKYESNPDTNAFTDSEKNKLLNIEASANNYTHPSTHPATIIAQTATARFVSDTEKATWNGKAERAPLASTGTAIQFDQERTYGSNASPITGNLTTNTTGPIAGVTAKIFHKKASPAPTMPATWKKANGSLNYDFVKVNRIYVQYEDANNIIYTISYE